MQFVASDSNHYKFTGKERDSESGLDYFGARYYSNGLGRWISADWSATPVPVPYADFGDPQSFNLYGYVRNIPTVKVDLDGHGDPPVRTLPEPTPADWALIDAAEPVSPLVPVVVFGAPVVAATWFAATHPAQAPEDGSFGPYGDMYVYSASSSQGPGQTQTQGQTQTEESKPQAEPATAAAGGAKKGGGSTVQENKAKGDAYRDEVADALKAAGKDVKTEVTKKTPFGTRRMDIEVKHSGKASGVETKTGNSRYRPSQRAKDNYLKKHGYPVNVVRKPKD